MNEKRKTHSRYTTKGAVTAECLKKTIRYVFKKIVFERGNAIWIDEITQVTKRFKTTEHSSTKKTPVHTSSKEGEDYGYTFLVEKKN